MNKLNWWLSGWTRAHEKKLLPRTGYRLTQAYIRWRKGLDNQRKTG